MRSELSPWKLQHNSERGVLMWEVRSGSSQRDKRITVTVTGGIEECAAESGA